MAKLQKCHEFCDNGNPVRKTDKAETPMPYELSPNLGDAKGQAAAEKGEAVKQPMEADFDVQVREGHVVVTFRPTESHMSFGILVDPKDIARLGRLSRSANVRHAKTGDTGDYSASEVEAVAFRLASAAINDR